MRLSRWLSTFTVIGVLLLALGVAGLILGPHFVYDPGQPVTGKEAWCYLAIGALMVLNGVLSPAPPASDDSRKPIASSPAGRSARKTVSPAPASSPREATVSAADKGAE